MDNGNKRPEKDVQDGKLRSFHLNNDSSDTRSVQRYLSHLGATLRWLQKSVDRGCGGSSAFFSPLYGWAAPYPETTGYLIPTLIEQGRRWEDPTLTQTAVILGEWLMNLQREDGAWPGGLYRVGQTKEPSVFNTAQVLRGLMALYRETEERRWLTACHTGAQWIGAAIDGRGRLRVRDYRSDATPAYYAYVAPPLLDVAQAAEIGEVADAAKRLLDHVVALQKATKDFEEWGFRRGKPAFTHTIAYTLQGLQESACFLNDGDFYWSVASAAIEKLLRKAELSGGRLPGAYGPEWQPVRWYSCLTGNAQIALCLLAQDRHAPDLRIVNGAAKLVDTVCERQWLYGAPDALRGAVAGSTPLWGRYMTLRYPNWAAKYHCDALTALIDRLRDAREATS